MPVQEMLLSNKIDMGHARALLSLTAAEQIQIAHQIIAKTLSVRETERKGKLIVEFHDWDQFQGLLDKLKLQDLLEQNN